eukprot:1180022-Prorocentrum_minimum.AAC.7
MFTTHVTFVGLACLAPGAWLGCRTHEAKEKTQSARPCRLRDATGSAPVRRPCARRPGVLPHGKQRRAQCNSRRI